MSRTDEAADSETSVTNECKVIENHQNYLLFGAVFLRILLYVRQNH